MILNYAYGYDETVAKFVADLIPAVRGRGFGNCSTIGIVEGNMLIAGLVYHGYQPEAGVIEISAAALPNHYWLTRETIKKMYQYPFLGCRCQMVVQTVSANDERQLYMLSRFGHSLITVPRMLGRTHDGVLALLTYEDWLETKFCKKYKHHINDDSSIQKAA